MDSLKNNIQKYIDEHGCNIDKIAHALHVDKLQVIQNLPKNISTIVKSDNFDTIMDNVATWGELLFVKITPSFVIEVKTSVPKGKYGHGYYNFDTKKAPLGGHLLVDDIDTIVFLSTKVIHGMLSYSIQFFDKHGENIFKLYVSRDENRKLITSQVEAFKELENKYK